MSDLADKAATLADAMLHAAGLDDVPMIHICQGPPRCEYNGTQEDWKMPCPWCTSIRADDPRSGDEIVETMKKAQS